MLKSRQNRIPESLRIFAGQIKVGTFAVGMLSGVLFFPAASAATYYVSNTGGNDSYNAAQAQNIGTPWKTIQKAAYNRY